MCVCREGPLAENEIGRWGRTAMRVYNTVKGPANYCLSPGGGGGARYYTAVAAVLYRYHGPRAPASPNLQTRGRRSV